MRDDTEVAKSEIEVLPIGNLTFTYRDYHSKVVAAVLDPEGKFVRWDWVEDLDWMVPHEEVQAG